MKKYIVTFIVLSFVFILGSSFYKQVQKDMNAGKSTRIECQKKATSFERVYIPQDIKFAQEQLKSGNVRFSSSVKKAHYSKSELFEYVSLAQMDEVLQNVLNQNIVTRKVEDSKLDIKYYIYENDVNDPGKKTEKSKLYAGYVVFQFFNVKKEPIYQVQIDFSDKKGADLSRRIECAIESFITIK